MLIAPPWLLFGGATDSKDVSESTPPLTTSNPHLAPGVHPQARLPESQVRE